MAELVNCIECNQRYSSTLQHCPHCKTRYPQGLHCVICGGFGKLSEMEETVIGYGWPIGFDHCNAHKICIAEVKHEFESKEHRLVCPTCSSIAIGKVHFNDSGKIPLHGSEGPHIITCKSCGENLNSYSRCPICNFAVFIQDAIKIPTNADPKFAHNYCYRKRPLKLKTDCFIATAACGAYSPEVIALRYFRDTILLPSMLGRILVRSYKFLSPSLAKVIEGNITLRALVRKIAVTPAYRLLKYLNGYVPR